MAISLKLSWFINDKSFKNEPVYVDTNKVVDGAAAEDDHQACDDVAHWVAQLPPK